MKGRRVKNVLGCGFLVLIVFVVGSLIELITSEDEPAPVASPAVVVSLPTSTPAASPTSAATLEPVAALEAEINKRLSRSNRGDGPRARVSLDGGALDIRWSINDNLTADMIRRSADLDAETIIGAVLDAGLDFDSLRLVGEWDFGEGERAAISATFDPAVLGEVSRDNVWELGERVQINPAFTPD